MKTQTIILIAIVVIVLIVLNVALFFTKKKWSMWDVVEGTTDGVEFSATKAVLWNLTTFVVMFVVLPYGINYAYPSTEVEGKTVLKKKRVSLAERESLNE